MFHSRADRMDDPVDKSLREATVPCLFTFVPALQKLPIKSRLETTSGVSKGTRHENMDVETTREAPLFTAVYVPNTEDREGRSGLQSQRKTDASAPPCDLVSRSALTDTDRSESPGLWGQAVMEAARNKHTDISPPHHQRVPGREVSLGCTFPSQRDRASPVCPPDLFPTPSSSRESILSACSDRDVSPPLSSRTISPCSSVYSGMFTPSVLPVKKHFLAPGSSLISLPQSCRSSYESLSCPMSPTPTRHRPPLTRLSLLTAILRKGRLPVLSSAVQRPYTPCWPVNSVTLSRCSACSAASSVASIPLELSSEFSSTTSIDSQSEAFRDPKRCATAPPLFGKTCSHTQKPKTNAVPRWQQLISPPPPTRSLKSHKQNVSLQLPQPVCSTIVKSVSPVNLHRSYVSVSKPKSPTLKPSFCLDVDARSSSRLSCLSPDPALELDTGVPRKWTRLLPGSSLSQLQSLSQQLKASSPSANVTPCPTYSPPPRVTGRPERPPHPPSRCLSPAFTGWPSPRASPSSTPASTPAPPFREFSPSPSLTPSPRPGSAVSDGSDREGTKRKPRKIKSSYKSLAAIPTNTLLLDQQVIDEQVERGEEPTGDRGVPLSSPETDPHSEMCSPAWLRKESEELYAVIDEILASSASSTSKSKSAAVKEAQKNSSTFPKSYGRETKYACVSSLYSNGNDERHVDPHKTKPGVIRSRLTAQDLQKTSELSPFRQILTTQQQLRDGPKGENTCGSRLQEEEEGRPGPPSCDLHITEPEEHRPRPPKHGLPIGASSSFCPAERQLEAFETQI